MKITIELTGTEISTLLSAISRDLSDPSNSLERTKRLDDLFDKIYDESIR